MKVTVDLDPRDVWRIQEKAERLGVRPGDVLREELAVRRGRLEFAEAVKVRVLAGLDDATIGTEFNLPVNRIADTRRGLGLPANRRRHVSVPVDVDLLPGTRLVDKEHGRLVEVVAVVGDRAHLRVVWHPTIPTAVGRNSTPTLKNVRARYRLAEQGENV